MYETENKDPVPTPSRRNTGNTSESLMAELFGDDINEQDERISEVDDYLELPRKMPNCDPLN